MACEVIWWGELACEATVMACEDYLLTHLWAELSWADLSWVDRWVGAWQKQCQSCLLPLTLSSLSWDWRWAGADNTHTQPLSLEVKQIHKVIDSWPSPFTNAPDQWPQPPIHSPCLVLAGSRCSLNHGLGSLPESLWGILQDPVEMKQVLSCNKHNVSIYTYTDFVNNNHCTALWPI